MNYFRISVFSILLTLLLQIALEARPSIVKQVTMSNGKVIDIVHHDLDDDGEFDYTDVFYDGDWLGGWPTPKLICNSGQQVDTVSLPTNSTINASTAFFQKCTLDTTKVMFAIQYQVNNVQVGTLSKTTCNQECITYTPVYQGLVAGIDNLDSKQSATIVYPNPTTNDASINVTLPSSAKAEKVLCSGVDGKIESLPFDINANSIEIERVSGMVSGIYILRILCEDGKIINTKLIIQ
jgi:hypothetical protein